MMITFNTDYFYQVIDDYFYHLVQAEALAHDSYYGVHLIYPGDEECDDSDRKEYWEIPVDIAEFARFAPKSINLQDAISVVASPIISLGQLKTQGMEFLIRYPTDKGGPCIIQWNVKVIPGISLIELFPGLTDPSGWSCS